MTYCQNFNIIGTDTVSPTTEGVMLNQLRSVPVRVENPNGSYRMETWFAMPRERYSLISNELSRIRKIADLVPYLDSTIIERDALLNIRAKELLVMEKKVSERDIALFEGAKAFTQMKGKFNDCTERSKDLEKTIKKLRKGKKAWTYTAAGILGGAVIAVILSRAL